MRAGAGCLFEELYQALDPYQLGIVGGSGLSGVGLAGWMLGGGYSVKTSQRGLGIDNLVAVRLVLPNGDIKVASKLVNQDLFFAIKVGYKRCSNTFSGSELALLGRSQQLWYTYRIHAQSS